MQAPATSSLPLRRRPKLKFSESFFQAATTGTEFAAGNGRYIGVEPEYSEAAKRCLGLGDYLDAGEGMSHRVALYTVQVRPKRDKEQRLLGNFDEAGSSLIEVLQGYLSQGFSSSVEDGTKEVRVVSCVADENGEEFHVTATHGKSGLKATIVDGNGQLRLEQEAADSQLVPCACLFRLPPQQRRGWLAIHVNDGRGIKSLLDAGIQERFQNDYPDFLLHLYPYVERSVLDKALEEDRVEKVKLIKLERPSDQAMATTNQWIPGGAVGKYELSISVRTRGEHVIADPIRRFLGSENPQRDEIIEFEGVEFDEASVEVSTDEGGQKTFNIEKPQAGHAFTEDLDDLDYENDEPTPASILAALGDALDRVA
jgi:hypothetical protein